MYLVCTNLHITLYAIPLDTAVAILPLLSQVLLVTFGGICNDCSVDMVAEVHPAGPEAAIICRR